MIVSSDNAVSNTLHKYIKLFLPVNLYLFFTNKMIVKIVITHNVLHTFVTNIKENEVIPSKCIKDVNV